MSTATVSRWGNSLGLRLPKPVAKATGLKAGSKVAIAAVEDGMITITPVHKRPSYKLEDLLSQVTECNRHTEIDWGGDVGNEQIE
jgi:antitoxin MazE